MMLSCFYRFLTGKCKFDNAGLIGVFSYFCCVFFDLLVNGGW
ncbi:hypothetical protein ECDEC10A_5779 [Escherichia coli DEC10A]|nr:hypothetical protein ECDEC10A_5779 [Escherichia coli DEC10A]